LAGFAIAAALGTEPPFRFLVEGFNSHLHSPAGHGTSKWVITTVAQITSTFAGVLTFDAPVLSSVLSLNGPTHQLYSVTVSGAQFGVAAPGGQGTHRGRAQTTAVGSGVDTAVDQGDVCVGAGHGVPSEWVEEHRG
jgi:hypothetical protein